MLAEMKSGESVLSVVCIFYICERVLKRVGVFQNVNTSGFVMFRGGMPYIILLFKDPFMSILCSLITHDTSIQRVRKDWLLPYHIPI